MPRGILVIGQGGDSEEAKRLLDTAGYSVTTNDGPGAPAQVKTDKPGLLLVALAADTGETQSLVAGIQATPYGAMVPVVFFGGAALNPAEAVALGGDVHLPTPLTWEALIPCVTRITGQKPPAGAQPPADPAPPSALGLDASDIPDPPADDLAQLDELPPPWEGPDEGAFEVGDPHDGLPFTPPRMPTVPPPDVDGALLDGLPGLPDDDDDEGVGDVIAREIDAAEARLGTLSGADGSGSQPGHGPSRPSGDTEDDIDLEALGSNSLPNVDLRDPAELVERLEEKTALPAERPAVTPAPEPPAEAPQAEPKPHKEPVASPYDQPPVVATAKSLKSELSKIAADSDAGGARSMGDSVDTNPLGPQGGTTQPPVDDLADSMDATERLVTERIRLVHEGDYFALLDVSTNADSGELKQAYHEALEIFDPERLGPELGERYAEELRDIKSLLQEAWEVLRDESLRVRYQAHLGGGSGRGRA